MRMLKRAYWKAVCKWQKTKLPLHLKIFKKALKSYNKEMTDNPTFHYMITKTKPSVHSLPLANCSTQQAQFLLSISHQSNVMKIFNSFTYQWTWPVCAPTSS